MARRMDRPQLEGCVANQLLLATLIRPLIEGRVSVPGMGGFERRPEMKLIGSLADRMLARLVPSARASAARCWVASCCDSNLKLYCCNYDPDVRCSCIIHTSDCKG